MLGFFFMEKAKMSNNSYNDWRNGIIGDFIFLTVLYVFRRIIAAIILGGLLWYGFEMLTIDPNGHTPWTTFSTVKLVSPMVVIWVILTWSKF